MKDFYVPVSIESVETGLFPDVALFLKTAGNYVLYKSHGSDFTRQDAVRLIENKVEFLYVSPGDMEVINEYMESNAERLLKSDAFDARTKGKIMYQTSINFVGDIFGNPQKAGDLERSKRLMENLMLYLANDPNALGSLETVMTHNYYTFVHSIQVTALAIMMHSEAYMLSRDEMVDVGMGCILHDIGKMFISADILNKSGKLTDSEIAIFRRHPQEGYKYLKEKTTLSELSLSIVRDHHERNNGNGYPSGLKGEQLSRSVQVAALCDVYCSLAVDKTGRKGLSPWMILHLMRQEMQGSFNDKLLDTLETLVCIEGEGGPFLL